MEQIQSVVWHWPQWYFAVLYAIMFVAQAVKMVFSTKGQHKLDALVAIALQAFGVYTLHVGGFW